MRIPRLILLTVTVPIWAQIVTVPRVGVGVIEHKLSLADAIQSALVNNLDIEIQRTTTATAAQAVRGAQGVFDPTFRWLPGVESRNTPTTSPLQGAGGKLSEDFLTQNFYFNQKTPWRGASFNLAFENGRQSTSNSFASLTPYLTSRLVIGFTQPLWRNRVVDAERSQLRIRRKQLNISETDFEVIVIDIVTRVEQAYWDLVAARQDVGVTADAVKLAQEQLARDERMVASGSLAPIELSASRAELERRRDTYYASVGTLTEVENNLKLFLAPDRKADLWNEQLVPTDERLAEPSETDDFRQVVAAALKQRPEVRQVNLRQESNAIEKQLSADQTRPQMNLVASYSNSGLGGSVRQGEDPFSASTAQLYDRLNQLSTIAGLPPVSQASFGSLPGNIIGGYGTALSGLFGGNYQSVQVGVALDLTLHNHAAQAQYAQSAIAEKRLKLEQARIEQAIEAQVRNTLQAIQTARQRVQAAQASEVAAREKLESETRLFQTGESTNFFVLTRQNEYLDSRRRVVVAVLDLNKAIARLEQAAGNTLSTHGLTLK